MKSFVDALQERIQQLEKENQELKMHAPYGILTRAAFELEKRTLTNGEYAVFGDVDEMHRLNTEYGYETVNKRIREALHVRTGDLLLTGLWFSGDEFVFIIKGDAEKFCNRIEHSFYEQHMGITLAYAQIIDGNVDVAIMIASETV